MNLFPIVCLFFSLLGDGTSRDLLLNLALKSQTGTQKKERKGRWEDSQNWEASGKTYGTQRREGEGEKEEASETEGQHGWKCMRKEVRSFRKLTSQLLHQQAHINPNVKQKLQTTIV